MSIYFIYIVMSIGMQFYPRRSYCVATGPVAVVVVVVVVVVEVVIVTALVALVILNTGPIRRNRRRSTLRSSGFTSKHIISHRSV